MSFLWGSQNYQISIGFGITLDAAIEKFFDLKLDPSVKLQKTTINFVVY